MSITLDATISAVKVRAESSVYSETGQDLVDKVRGKIQDDSYTTDDILDRFNQGLGELAGDFLLPDLETWLTVTTDASHPFIDLPADYQKHLKNCHSVTSAMPIKIYGSLQQLYAPFRIHDQNGRVIGVAVHGRRLYYQRIPQSTELLTIDYYRYPERILTRNQKPTCLPPHLVEPLLVAYACKEIFAEIEDGIEGPQVNTDRWEKRYNKAKADLAIFLGPEHRTPVPMEQEIDWDWLALG